MKKLLYLIGFVTTIFLTTSFLFKALHWPGAGTILGTASFLLIFVLLPLLCLYFYKKEFSQYISYKLKYTFGYLGVALALLALVFKIMHWPGGSVLLLISVGVINFGFLPFLFYRMYANSIGQDLSGKKPIKVKYIFGFIGVVLFLTASVFKLLRWPGSAELLVISIFVINFGFLPFVFHEMYKKSFVKL